VTEDTIIPIKADIEIDVAWTKISDWFLRCVLWKLRM
jgi:hypothetical protein